MKFSFDRSRAFAPFAETVRWRQDKPPHLEGVFRASVFHGESQSESAGPSRGAFAADPWTVVAAASVAECAGLRAGDSLTRADGSALVVQQTTKDAALGWVIRCTANERAPK